MYMYREVTIRYCAKCNFRIALQESGRRGGMTVRQEQVLIGISIWSGGAVGRRLCRGKQNIFELFHRDGRISNFVLADCRQRHVNIRNGNRKGEEDKIIRKGEKKLHRAISCTGAQQYSKKEGKHWGQYEAV